MEVSFYVRKELLNKNGYAPIRMHITFSGQLIKKSIKGVTVKPEQWKEKKMRIRPNNKKEEYNFHIEYNSIIDELENKVSDIHRYALLNKIVLTKEFVLEKLEQKEKINIEHDFFDTFNEFINIHKTISSYNTTKGRITVFNYLKDFSEYSKKQIILDNIDNQFFEELRDYSYTVKGIKNNYFSKIVSIIKRFMAWAGERDYHSNIQYTKFKAPEQEIEVIYLNSEELMKLYNYEFKTERLSKVRDFYCFGCFTGLRFSDIKQLKPSNVHNDFIRLNIQKTKQTDHTIPLNKFSKEILEKYKDTPFEPIPTISAQKLNKYIKECCKEIGLDYPVTITRYAGSKKEEITLPKYELISSHTARKTFATVSLVLGMSERYVKSLTGHKRESSFNRYVKIADEEIKKQMEKTWDEL